MVRSRVLGETILAQDPGIHVVITCNKDHLVRVALSASTHFSYAIENASRELTTSLTDWLKAYANHKESRFPIDLPTHSFTGKVLSRLLRIPFGKTFSYKDIATSVGSPRGSRAVGNACRGNRFPLLIPCHRVIASDGSLGGFSCGLEIKKRLIEFEASI